MAYAANLRGWGQGWPSGHVRPRLATSCRRAGAQRDAPRLGERSQALARCTRRPQLSHSVVGELRVVPLHSMLSGRDGPSPLSSHVGEVVLLGAGPQVVEAHAGGGIAGVHQHARRRAVFEFPGDAMRSPQPSVVVVEVAVPAPLVVDGTSPEPAVAGPVDPVVEPLSPGQLLRSCLRHPDSISNCEGN